MEAISCKVIDGKGSEVGSVSLDSKIFGAKPNKSLVHETVRWQRARKRAGTHSTLTRSNMKGGGKKPWKQKGTGRARAGSIISPIWVGGAIVFGPQPRDYDFRLSKRTRRQALISALSEKVAAQKLVVVKDLAVESGKTKDMVKLLKSIGITDKRALLVFPGKSGEVECSPTWRSCRNIQGIKPLGVDGLNVYDILNSGVVVTTEAGISAVEARFKKPAAK